MYKSIPGTLFLLDFLDDLKLCTFQVRFDFWMEEKSRKWRDLGNMSVFGLGEYSHWPKTAAQDPLNGVIRHDRTPCLISDQVDYAHDEKYPCCRRKLSTMSSHCFDWFVLSTVSLKLEPWWLSLDFGVIAIDSQFATCYDSFQKGFCEEMKRPDFPTKHSYNKRKWAKTL